MDTIDTATWDDDAIADLIDDCVHDPAVDVDVGHARHIVAALRANGLLADAPLNVDGVRREIDRIAALGRSAFPGTFHFVTATIWGSQHHGPNAACQITLHIARASKSFAGPTPAAALADAERFIREHDPAAAEAAGWAILGVVRA